MVDGNAELSSRASEYTGNGSTSFNSSAPGLKVGGGTIRRRRWWDKDADYDDYDEEENCGAHWMEPL